MEKILSANSIFEELKKKLKEEILLINSNLSLASIKITKDSSLELYIDSQKKLAKELSIDYNCIEIDSPKKEDVIEEIRKLNKDKKTTGIIINRPLPENLSEEELFFEIDFRKDIEGVSPYNLGLLCLGRPNFISPTVLSILELLNLTGVDLYGKNVVLVGFSNIIGKPLSLILSKKFATVSVTHIATCQKGYLKFYVENADILISAVGKPCLIKGSWIKKGAIIIDAGISVVDKKVVGDVEFKSAYKKASFITPVPNGVGKLTGLFLFKNLLRAYKLIKGGEFLWQNL